MKTTHVWILLSATAFAAGCGPAGEAGTPVAFHVQASTSAPGSAPSSCGFTIESAQMVIRDVELKPVTDDPNDVVPDVTVGPFLIDLVAGDFNGAIQEAVYTANIPAGDYDEVRFDIHKLDDDDPAHQRAAAANPALQEMHDAGLSMRITGLDNNGAPYAFESSVNERQELLVDITIGLTDRTTSGVDGILLSIDATDWFSDLENTSCFEPANDNHRSQIEDNVKSSIDVRDGDGS